MESIEFPPEIYLDQSKVTVIDLAAGYSTTPSFQILVKGLVIR